MGQLRFGIFVLQYAQEAGYDGVLDGVSNTFLDARARQLGPHQSPEAIFSDCRFLSRKMTSTARQVKNSGDSPIFRPKYASCHWHLSSLLFSTLFWTIRVPCLEYCDGTYGNTPLTPPLPLEMQKSTRN